MCGKCDEIDSKREHYQKLFSLVTDAQTLDAIKLLIARMEAEKQALHPERTAVCADLDHRDRDPSMTT